MGIRHLLRSIRTLLGMPDRLSGELRDLDRAVRTIEKAVQQTSKRQDQSIATLSGEMASLRDEVHDRLLQYHLQLGRLSERVNGGSKGEPGSRVPVHIEGETRGNASSELDESSVSSGAVRLDPGEWMELPGCPTCRTTDRTIVCEWNKLALLASAPDEQSTRYDYAVCHGCGILYATRRPIGKRYRYLVDNFEDVIDKDAKNPLLNPHPLTDDDRDRYRRLIARGVFVSDHDPGTSLSSVLRDRMENAGHVDLLGSLLNPRGARVLEIRPRAGTILEGLRRLYGADVYAMPIWEGQQFIIQELYGIPTSTLIDFDRFQVPFEEPFDLIVCNHMFNHAVRLDGFLAAVHAALRTGGHLYLYNEIDDSEFLDGGQSMIATMNPLHLQASDRPSLVRALGAAGFEPVFVTGRHKRNVILVRKTDVPQWRPIGDADRARRIAAYHRARDRAVLRIPERIRSRFAEVWPATVGRAVASGVARFDDKGDLRIVKES
jgi:SAM-dependent methyltransferase